eukprot:6104277-Pyramimonas_sp.AAC.1
MAISVHMRSHGAIIVEERRSKAHRHSLTHIIAICKPHIIRVKSMVLTLKTKINKKIPERKKESLLLSLAIDKS